jgi:hypothetical protein
MFPYCRFALVLAASLSMIASRALIAAHPKTPVIHQAEVQAYAPEAVITSKRARDILISITNADGKLRGGYNDFCILFEDKATREPVNVRDVSVAFSLLVGRIEEEPIKASLAPRRAGRYCGHVNLGNEYYVPASYYVFVRYTDAGQQKRKQRLFLSVK